MFNQVVAAAIGRKGKRGRTEAPTPLKRLKSAEASDSEGPPKMAPLSPLSSLSSSTASSVPTEEEMAEIKAAVYSRCVNRRVDHAWSRCPKFVLEPFIQKMIDRAAITHRDVFLDIGCGIGNVVESMATRVGCKCVGIELVKSHYDMALEAHQHFQEHRESNGLPCPDVSFVKGDARRHAGDYLPHATVVWYSNLLFPIEVNVVMINEFKRTRPGTRIFCMKDLVPQSRRGTVSRESEYFTRESFEWGPGDVEWTDIPGRVYMYTRTTYNADQEGDEVSEA